MAAGLGDSWLVGERAMELLAPFKGAKARISYHVGNFCGTSRVVNVIRGFPYERIGLILKSTPFHPVDSAWPDQPADKGNIIWNGRSHPVEECGIYSVNQETNEIKQRSEVPKKERDCWASVIVHIINHSEEDAKDFLDAEVRCEVDEPYRESLNLQHSACHLSALALNKACEGYWKKDSSLDSLGNRDFDTKFILGSFIHEDHAEDQYRIGKSGKKEFDAERLCTELEEIIRQVNLFLNEWILTATAVSTEASGDDLDDTRMWKCVLPDGEASMPCGGTHVTSLSAFESIRYSIEVGSASGKELILKATTTATPSRA